MGQRVKQVWRALTARIDEKDKVFVSQWLTPEEASLFWGMNLPDQQHSLQVAYTARTLAAAEKDVNLPLLMRAALLHDVGKRKGDVSTWDKIATVLLHKLFGKELEHWGRKGRGSAWQNLRHAVYTYFHHPEESVQLLESLVCDRELLVIIAGHHQRPCSDIPRELVLLCQADDLN